KVGLVSAPALCRRWWAAPGAGAWRSFSVPNTFDEDSTPSAQPRRLSVSGVGKIADASLSISSLSGWQDRGLREQLVGLSDHTWRLRGFGDFWRSEEHTSELQSRFDLVCRLLLEKKKSYTE